MSLSVLLRISRGFLLPIFLQAAYLLVAPAAYAQNILKLYGQVIDENGPIFNALVTAENTNLRAYTDQDGFYYFYDIPPDGYRLICTFKSIEVHTNDKIAVDIGSPLRRDIFLKNGILNIAPIQVESSIPLPSEHSGHVVKIYDLDRTTGENVNDIINNIPGLNLIASPATGEINISANGIRPEGINVLIDGRKLNSLLTGRADLSQLPLKAISRIEYYTPGATAMASEGGLGGTVNFVTNKNPRADFIEASLANGSFDSEDYSISIAYSKLGLGKLNSLWEKGFVRNDYECTDNFDRIRTRENSFNSYDKYYLAYSNSIKAYYLNLSGFIYEGKNGVPGQINDPSSKAVSTKNTISVGGELSRLLGKSGRVITMLSYLERNAAYEDYGSWIPFDTKYYEREINWTSGLEYFGSEWLKINSKIMYENNLLYGHDFIRPNKALRKISREIYKVSGNMGFSHKIDRISLSAGLSDSYSYVDSRGYSTFSLTSAVIYKKSISIGLRSSYANSIRLPGLAELHWKEDVFVMPPDSALDPERSRSFTAEIFADLSMAGDWRLSVEYRDIRYKDLIYWRRSEGLKFKPVNVAKSDLFSTAAIVAYCSPHDLVKINFSRIKSVPLNREENQLYYGKYIIHQPLYINRLEISLNYRGHLIGADMYDSGERYFIEDNTKQLDPYTLVNLKAGIKTRFKTLQTMWEFKILNLTDKEYELLEYQPMPPRSYHCGVTFKI